MLLAAYDLCRPTAEVDLAALATPNEVEPVRDLVAAIAAIAATPLPPDSDDWLTFDLSDVRAETMREGHRYSGVRVRLVATLATTREPFHVDVNVGGPICPGPVEVSLSRPHADQAAIASATVSATR